MPSAPAHRCRGGSGLTGQPGLARDRPRRGRPQETGSGLQGQCKGSASSGPPPGKPAASVNPTRGTRGEDPRQGRLGPAVGCARRPGFLTPRPAPSPRGLQAPGLNVTRRRAACQPVTPGDVRPQMKQEWRRWRRPTARLRLRDTRPPAGGQLTTSRGSLGASAGRDPARPERLELTEL